MIDELAILVSLALLEGAVGVGARVPAFPASSPRFGRGLRQLNEEYYVDKALEGYYTNLQLEAHLQDFAQRCSPIAQLTTIGHSVQGVPLWLLEISDQPGESEPEPSVKYVANIHGDEPSGRQLLLALAEWLCASYEADPVALRVVRDLHLFLLPSMNPDGFELKARENAMGRDLNRDFPDPIVDPSMKPSGQEQPETEAVMNWTLATGGFVASAAIHEGELVVNYPWDGSASGRALLNATSDDAAFQFLSLVYSQHNLRMSASPKFPGGITNGAEWYPIRGGMQDWNYVAAGCFEVTLEVSTQKWPADLRGLFSSNRQSLLDYALTAALGGVRGQVFGNLTDQAWGAGSGVQPLIADVTVAGLDKVLQSRLPFGDFYRPLAPGNHTVMFSAPGFGSEEVDVVVPDDGSGVELEIYLGQTWSMHEAQSNGS